MLSAKTGEDFSFMRKRCVRTTIWLPPSSKRQLNALSRYLGRPQWGVIVEAMTAYEKSLSAADRKAIAQMLKR